MSLQTYNQLIAFDDREVSYNPETGEVGQVENLTTKNGIAMEFQANIKVLSGKDRYKIRSATFTIVGDNSSINTNTSGTKDQIGKALYGVIEAGSRLASDIAYMSKGVIVGLFAKLGKYRQDEMPINVPTGDNSWATAIFDNQPAHEYGSSECGRNNALPVTPASTAIRIPWYRDDFSRQDLLATIDSWNYSDADSGFDFTIGSVKFRNEQQTELIAYPCSNLRDLKAGQKSKPLGRLLNNNDVSLGIMSDHVDSEAFNTFTEGTDDDNVEVQP